MADQVAQSKMDGSCRGYTCSAHSVSVCPVSRVLVAEEASGNGKRQLGEGEGIYYLGKPLHISLLGFV